MGRHQLELPLRQDLSTAQRMETKYLRRDEVAVLLTDENSDHYYTSRIRTAKGYT